MFTEQDKIFMQRAIELAQIAQQQNEVPIGALVVSDNHIIGEGWNSPIKHSDPTAHAEVCALRAAASHLQNYRLLNTTLYVTLEPCIMCIGAIVHARVQRVVYGASDPKVGAVGFALQNKNQLNHQVEYCSGLLAEQSSKLLVDFFRQRRQ